MNGQQPPPGQPVAMQLVQPLSDLQFLSIVSLLLPEFEVPNPAYQEPSEGVEGTRDLVRFIPCRLADRFGAALQHIENAAYLVALGEADRAVGIGKARAAALKKQQVDAGAHRVATEDAAIEAERLAKKQGPKIVLEGE